MAGINWSPPKILFNQPKYKLEHKYIFNIIADNTFSIEERIYINAAIKNFEYFCNGILKFNIEYTLGHFDNVVSGHIILKVDANIEAIKFSDKKISARTLGLYAKYSDNLGIIYLVSERLYNSITFRTTTIHELGHLIGLDHTNINSIMHKINCSNILYPTYIDAKEFGLKYKCDPENLKYFLY